RSSGCLAPLRAQQRHQAFLAQRPADRRGRFATKLCDQPVVAAARTNGSLRAELGGQPLENGVRIVVEPAHQARIEHVLDADRIEMPAQPGEMLTRLFVQVLREYWRAGDHVLQLRILAVENAQRIAFEAPQAVGVELRLMAREVLDQLFTIDPPRSGRAERIEMQLDALQPQRAQQPRAEHDQLRVDVGTGKAECFGIELIELAEAPRLRPLVTEHRTGAPDALPLVVQQAVADHRAHDAGGRFGTQRQGVAARILEGEHLLLHDVGELADRALEQRRVLDDRHADFLVAVRGEQLARDAFEAMPARDVRREDVVHSTRRLNLLLRHSSRSAVFKEVSGFTEPSASITNLAPSFPDRRGITIGRSSTCAFTADASPMFTRSGGAPATVRTRPGVPMSNIRRWPDAS